MPSRSEEFLKKTIAVWQPFSTATLSRENAKKTAENITELFALLSEWEQKDGERGGNRKEEK